MSELPRIALVHGPTPIIKRRALDEWLGVDLWIKREDASSGPEAGNKVRKLEWLLGDALARGANVVVTCGGLQSNHARATALCAASLGLRSVLLLRVDGATSSPLPLTGNVLIDRMVGADVRPLSAEEYAQRNAAMEAVAAELRDRGERPYVIPEGGSNGLGALGFVACMREVSHQIRLGLAGSDAPFDLVVHACGSGGTAAGVALGAARYGSAYAVRPMAICDTAAHFERAIARITTEARAWDPSLVDPVPTVVDDTSKGPAYAVTTPEQRLTMLRAARSAGVLLDPVYTGKAFHGLESAIARGDVRKGARVLFLHTGGLPGLLAQGADFARELR